MRVALLTLALLAAGCVSMQAEPPGDDATRGDATAPVTPPAPDFDFAALVEPDHGAHAAATLHAKEHGLSLRGHAGLGTLLPPTVPGSISAIDVWGTWAVVAGRSGGLGFALFDVSDPAAPKPVSWFPSDADGWTARFSHDGEFVFYGCQPSNKMFLFGTCGASDTVAPGPDKSSIVVVDVKDKANPKFASVAPSTGAHNLYAAVIDGVEYVFTDRVQIFRFDAANATLHLVSEVPGWHDATVQRHPLTGQWLLFTGLLGNEEFGIYDVSDPANPELVWSTGPSPGYRGWHEHTLVPGVVDGRVILAVGPESLASNPTRRDVVTFLDVTDPASPEVVGEWRPPFSEKVPWGGYLFSAHEMAATPTGQVAVAWYHAGVWVVDVSTRERQADPVTLAAYLPHEDIDVLPSVVGQTPTPVVPSVWGVGWDARGYLLVPDAHTGLYVLEPAWGLVPAMDSGQ